MEKEKIQKLVEALDSIGYEITSLVVGESERYFIEKIYLEIIPKPKSKNNNTG